MMFCCVLAAAIATPLSDAVAEIHAASPPLDSDGLLQVVTRHFAGQAIEHEQSSIGALLHAWNTTRQRPSVQVDDVRAAIAHRRDSVSTLDVVYHASMFIDPNAAGPLHEDLQVGGQRTWWGRWTRTPLAVRRIVAPDLRTLLDESPASELVAAGCDARGTWSLRGDGVLALPVAQECNGGQVLGLEGPWLGTAMLASIAHRGLAVVPSHDVAHMLESLPAGAAVVEDDGAMVTLRVGWTNPLFVWLDPAEDWAIRRVVRLWSEGEVDIELETTPSAWIPTAAGVDVPTQIHIVQRVRGSGMPPMMECTLRAIWLQAGESVEWDLVRPP